MDNFSEWMWVLKHDWASLGRARVIAISTDERRVIVEDGGERYWMQVSVLIRTELAALAAQREALRHEMALKRQESAMLERWVFHDGRG